MFSLLLSMAIGNSTYESFHSEGTLGSSGIRALALVFASLCAAWGGQINFTGTFTQDDQIQLFLYSVQVGGPVTVFTTSYDGTASGGFSPILSVFQADGTYVNGNAGYSGDTNASVTWVSDANEDYIVALTEWDNSPLLFPTGTLSDGFTEQGNGDFTAVPPFSAGGPGGFYTGPGGTQTTGNWAVTFSADDGLGLQASTVPEPGTSILLVGGLALMLGSKSLRKRFFGKGQEA